MRFRLWRSPGGVVAEAEEIGRPPGQGHHVKVIGDQDVDVHHLVSVLRERLQAEIGTLHLEKPDHRAGWILRGDEVAGRLEWSGHDSPYDVVVDGRTLSWEDLGRALERFEGFRFRLVLSDPYDPRVADDASADIVTRPPSRSGIAAKRRLSKDA